MFLHCGKYSVHGNFLFRKCRSNQTINLKTSLHLCAVLCVSACPVSLYSVIHVRGTFLTPLLPAASPFSASKFLATYEDEFLDVVNAKQSLLKLKRKGVISHTVRTSIEDANDEDAKYHLFEHLEKNATVDTLREYCEVAIAADGFPRMQALGRKMMKALPLGGWWVHGVGVGWYISADCT